MDSTKLTPAAIAVASAAGYQAEEINHEAAAPLRRIQARDAGIIGDRAALQRSLEGTGRPETAHERKTRLITRATERLVAMGFSRRDAKRVARQSYNLARKDTAQ